LLRTYVEEVMNKVIKVFEQSNNTGCSKSDATLGENE
jgi:hypothetical protein